MGNRYTERECLNALRTAAEELGEPPTQDAYQTVGLSPSTSVIADRCGSWRLALAKAGLDRPSQRQYTKEDCLRSIQAVADNIRGEPTVSDYKESGYKPSTTTISEICGTWTEAKEMAGVVEEEEDDEEKSEEEIREEVRERLNELTRAADPSVEE